MQRESPLGYGSELRKPEELEPLFNLHPNWAHLKKILTSGSSWNLTELSEEKRQQDVSEAFFFGNHKGAKSKPDLLRELVLKDVIYGYSLVLPLEKIASISSACMAPMNIAPQKQLTSMETSSQRIVSHMIKVKNGGQKLLLTVVWSKKISYLAHLATVSEES